MYLVVKVKTSLCSVKHHALKIYGRVIALPFLTLALKRVINMGIILYNKLPNKSREVEKMRQFKES
jgi:hypothetical protein